jgi:soluble lytic murein transglycosylase-like protein
MERLEQVRRNERAMNELVYGTNLTETDRLILRVTRRLGECELTAPQSYLNEVKAYIAKWQSTSRYADALQRAQDYGYVSRIAEELLAHNLPPDFFYLAMQESSFNPGAIGPPTRYGIAKGMWQFIPETGRRFGLKIGPLSREARPDADDARHDWSQATTAAARYIKEIYTTDAQASGLLVIASYNWGEHRIIDRVRDLPNNPRDRNFWKLIERFRIPEETYNYVFYIVSAAVIGENPRAFGFQFDNPLASALERYDASR